MLNPKAAHSESTASHPPLRVSAGLEEQGVIVGNYYDKYGSRNPIVRRLMRGFEDALETLVHRSGARTIHEIGCGEGHWTINWASNGKSARGSDFSEQVIALARANADAAGVSDAVDFRVASIYDLTPAQDAAELVVCCEVLEHLDDPERALHVLRELARPWLLASVPREPIWSSMNMARGKYLASWGNTPGHVQKWSAATFVDFISSQFEIVAIKRPLPWTMVLARAR